MLREQSLTYQYFDYFALQSKPTEKLSEFKNKIIEKFVKHIKNYPYTYFLFHPI